MVSYIQFWIRMILWALKGNTSYYLWTGFLLCLIGLGASHYKVQFTQGFIATNISQKVSWGSYIANFTYLVGVAAAAVLLVFPSYVYHNKAIKEVVLLGELLAVSAILMCLLFIGVDLGRSDHFWHIIPVIGKLNFPTSILAWDVVVLNIYLVLNLYVPGYLLYKKYAGKPPTDKTYLPFVYVSIIWAISIHTVTAFLYVGLGGRPYWNAAILAPRFLVSAFAGGPAILILIFKTVNYFSEFKIQEAVFEYLKKVFLYAMLANLFLLGCEVYKEFYTQSLHLASMRYLFFGLHGHHMLVPYIWSALTMEVIAIIILLFPRFRNNWKYLRVGCVFAIIGIWVEKGMGLLIPGFIPSSLGDIVEYTPSIHEFFICIGIWACGALAYTVMAKISIAIQLGHLKEENQRHPF